MASQSRHAAITALVTALRGVSSKLTVEDGLKHYEEVRDDEWPYIAVVEGGEVAIIREVTSTRDVVFRMVVMLMYKETTSEQTARGYEDSIVDTLESAAATFLSNTAANVQVQPSPGPAIWPGTDIRDRSRDVVITITRDF